MAKKVYLNGSFIDEGKACISVKDRGFLCGAGLFETIRAYNGKPLTFERHTERLYKFAAEIGITNLPGAKELHKDCIKLIALNGLTNARVRITVSHGVGETLLDECLKPTILITVEDYIPPDKSKYENGYKVEVCRQRHDSAFPLFKLKSTSYLASFMVRREFMKRGFDEAIYLNEKGNITEAVSANIFFIRHTGGIFTPPVKSGLLGGITRDIVIKLAQDLGYKVEESDVALGDIEDFDEVFLTSSTIEVMPVSSIQYPERNFKVAIGTGKPGKITAEVAKAYKKFAIEQTS